MPKKEAKRKIGDVAVKKRTGHGYDHWFKIIDKFDRRKNGHKATAKHLNEKHGVDEWYAQMITVEYERKKGIRETGQRITGSYEVSISRTVNVPIEKAFEAWAKPSALNKWFTTGAKQKFQEGGTYSNNDKDKGEFKRIVPNKRIRFTWDNERHCPGSVVEVRFDEKGPEKVAITIQHEKLPDKKGRDGMKEGWSWALDSYKSYLETGKGITFEEWKKSSAK